MGATQEGRLVTVGRVDDAWFTQTDDGFAAWYPSRKAAFDAAWTWMLHRREAHVRLLLDDRDAVLLRDGVLLLPPERATSSVVGQQAVDSDALLERKDRILRPSNWDQLP